MKSALVKIDVAADITGKAIPVLFDMADGAALIDGSLTWVFDLSSESATVRRDLRFWRTELESLNQQSAISIQQLTIEQVIICILPVLRNNFHAGEVDQLFQIRHNTRRELLDSAGMTAGRNFYSRAALADFLQSRWLGNSKALKGRNVIAQGEALGNPPQIISSPVRAKQFHPASATHSGQPPAKIVGTRAEPVNQLASPDVHL